MKVPSSLMSSGFRCMREGSRTDASPGVGTGCPWCRRPLVLAGGFIGVGSAPPAVRAGNSRAKWIAHAVRGDADLPPARPSSRLLLQHPVRRSRSGFTSELVQNPGPLWAGAENRGHTERVSVLLRYAGPGLDRLVESFHGGGRPASSRGWLSRGGRSGCITTLVPTCRSTTLTRSHRDQAPIPIRSISTGCGSAGLGGSRSGRPTDRISGERFSAASAMNDCTRATMSSGSGVSPSRIIALHQSCTAQVLMNSSCWSLALSRQSRRTSGADGLISRIRGAFREVFVGHLQEPLHLGAHAPVSVDETARAVGQTLRFAHLPDPIAKRCSEQLQYAVKPALLARALARRLVRLGRWSGFGEIEVGGVDRGQRLSLVGMKRVNGEFVDRIGQEQDLEPLAAENLEVRTLGDRRQVVAPR